MPIMVKDDKNFLFIHIPKCGGSTFEKSMESRGWHELLSIRGVHANNMKFMKCSTQHFHAELLEVILNTEFLDEIITIVRDPFSRLKSEYAWQLKQAITNLPPADWIDHVFEEYTHDPFVYDNHIRPQNEFILSGTSIYKLEENGIEQAANYISPITKKSSLFRAFGKDDIKHIKKTDKPEELHYAFEKKASIIEKFYAKDYEILNYNYR
ncbi:sulfotransferase family 2 domain-containing protein [Psychromonas sp.]|uniref:sulfotransferase family 2 domain-containing protein n=1 Tax=Psychromonas sp. TaxID=1884585 RepID=UPI003A984982